MEDKTDGWVVDMKITNVATDVIRSENEFICSECGHIYPISQLANKFNYGENNEKINYTCNDCMPF